MGRALATGTWRRRNPVLSSTCKGTVGILSLQVMGSGGGEGEGDQDRELHRTSIAQLLVQVGSLIAASPYRY